MASTFRCLCRSTRQLSTRSWRIDRQPRLIPHLATSRALTRSAVRRDETPETALPPTPPPAGWDQAVYDDLDEEDQETYRLGSEEDRREFYEEHHTAVEEEIELDESEMKEIKRVVRQHVDDLDSNPDIRRPRMINMVVNPARGYYNTGEEDDDDDVDMGPDDPYYNEDISSMGHGELEQHRELRQMARTAAWEMPLLAELQIPFNRTVEDERQTPLRFRYTTYLGEHHASTKKVVVEFDPRHLGLKEPQLLKMIKLAGSRFDPHRYVIKMSTESLDTQAQNKRLLGETVARLLAAARNTATDSFEDVPLDFRHATSNRRGRQIRDAQTTSFPSKWILTEQRKAALESGRRQRDAVLLPRQKQQQLPQEQDQDQGQDQDRALAPGKDVDSSLEGGAGETTTLQDRIEASEEASVEPGFVDGRRIVEQALTSRHAEKQTVAVPAYASTSVRTLSGRGSRLFR